MSSTARPDAQLLRERRPRRRVGLGDRRRDQQRDRGQEEQARLHAGADPVVLLDVVLESAEQKRRAQHEQRVGDDRAGDGRLHQHVFAGAQGGERDDQFGQVPQRGVEQPTRRVAGLGRDGLGGVTQQCGQWHDGEHGQHEQQRVRFGLELRGCKHHRHKCQQPEQRVVTDFLEQRVHSSAHLSPSSVAAVNAFTAIAATRAVTSTPHTPMTIASTRVSSDLGARSP